MFLCLAVIKGAQFDQLEWPRTLRSQVSVYNIDWVDFVPYQSIHRPLLSPPPRHPQQAIPSPRVLNVHAHFEQMSRDLINNKHCKVVYVTRDPRDVAVSFFHFTCHFGYDGKWKDYFSLFLSGNGIILFANWNPLLMIKIKITVILPTIVLVIIIIRDVVLIIIHVIIYVVVIIIIRKVVLI